MTHRRPHLRLLRLALLSPLVLVALVTAGCQLFGMLAYGLAGGESAKPVKAQYADLQGKTFAVLVSADSQTLSMEPDAPRIITRSVSREIAASIEGSKPADPRQISRFQDENPYWITVPYSELLRRLAVDRLIVIDLVQYASHEPGNAHVWKGQAVANVGVAELEASNPDGLVLSTTIRTTYPQDAPVGLLKADPESFRVGLLMTFTNDVVNLFRDHRKVTK